MGISLGDLGGIGAVATTVSNIVDKFFPDKSQVEKDKMALIMLQAQGELTNSISQLDVNKVEASNPSLFVSGWRPFIGWICGIACAWNWVFLPIAIAATAKFGYKITISPANLSEMMPVLMGMLGLGGLRTFEKLNGVAAK